MGSDKGQHRFFNPKCVVREEQESEHKYVPQYGYFEMRARFAAAKSEVAALWMIGFEDTPEKSAELCIVEIKGWDIKKHKAKIGIGIHKFNDPKFIEDFSENEYNIDATEFHICAVEWTKEKIVFSIDHIKFKEIDQSPDYPKQFMFGFMKYRSKLQPKQAKTFLRNF